MSAMVFPEALLNSTRNPAKIVNRDQLKYVTENFNLLQGFHMALAGVLFAVIRISEVALKDSDWRVVPLVIAAVLFTLMVTWVPRYYRKRFGCVQQVGGPLSLWSTKQIVVTVGASVFFLFVLMAAHVTAGLYELTFSPLIIYMGLKDDCRRIYFVPLGLAMEIIAVIPFWGILQDDQLVVWKVVNAGSVGFTFMIAGVCDHIMLTRLMPKRVAERDGD